METIIFDKISGLYNLKNMSHLPRDFDVLPWYRGILLKKREPHGKTVGLGRPAPVPEI